MRTIIDKVREKFILIDNLYKCNLDNSNTDSSYAHKFYNLIDLPKDKRLEYLSVLIPNKKKQLLDRIFEADKTVFISVNEERDELTGYFCTSLVNQYESGIKTDIVVPKGYVYFFDDYVLETERGKGIHKESVKYRKNYFCMNKLASNAMVCIYSSNHESIKSYLNNGFKHFKSIYCIRPLRKIWERPRG